MKVTLLLLAFVACALAHSVLQTPTPYNTNPTKTGLCGVNTITPAMRSTPSAVWSPGDTVSISWHLVASDGGGKVIGLFDPRGGTNFTVAAWTPFDTAGSNKFYTQTFKVPDNLDCSQSPTKLCTMRVYTDSGWVSCTTVNISTCNPSCKAIPVTSTCTTLTTATPFCNATVASVRQGATAADIDAELQSTWTTNRANPNVFTNGNSAACQASYKDFLCTSSLPPCDPTSGALTKQACRGQCRQTMEDCQVTEEHRSLYDCDSLPLCNGEVASGFALRPFLVLVAVVLFFTL